MAEYIDRESIYKTLSMENPFGWNNDDLAELFREAKASDVAPIRHGRWIPLTECVNEGVYCSICKKKVWKSDYAKCSKKSRNKLESNYCPNCGAKMDEKENDK